VKHSARRSPPRPDEQQTTATEGVATTEEISATAKEDLVHLQGLVRFDQELPIGEATATWPAAPAGWTDGINHRSILEHPARSMPADCASEKAGNINYVVTTITQG